MDKFRDREEAGKHLAEKLSQYSKRTDVIVLALPRGGVPVAYQIATALSVPLDVFIVRKLGAPGHEELAMGALAAGGITVFNEEVIRNLSISKKDIETVKAAELAELKRREKKYRGDRPMPDLKNKIIILVDDGIATGATMRAAITALRQSSPAKIIMAVPVAEISTYQKMSSLVDEVICLLIPNFFYAVGQWYDHFSQTSDEEVRDLLGKG